MGAVKHGIVAAGHPATAEAGAHVLREGGNAVDAAVAAMLASFVAEPLLSGLGAGGYMMLAGGDLEPALLDFFIEAPPRPAGARGAELEAVDVSFGDAAQVFYIGPASCGVYGAPAGVCAAMARWGSVALSDLTGPAAELARKGVALNAGQAYVAEILGDLLRATPECAALWAPGGTLLREGQIMRNEELAEALVRLGSEGAAPFYTGDIAAAVCEWLAARGGSIDAEALAGYRAVVREPLAVSYRGRSVLTNPPPAAGGLLLAYALALLDRQPPPPSLAALVSAMEAAQAERTPEFLAGLGEDGYAHRFLGSRLGATTHISVLDADGRACAVTATNGEGSAVVVPGTGIHLNNVMGEEDLSPLGFHSHPVGMRMPSMMAPTVVLRDDHVELVLGSAGSNRIRSALLQTIVGAVDHGMDAPGAVCAPRVHYEHGVVYHEPGINTDELGDREIVAFHDLNLFFGGVQAVLSRGGRMSGAGDPRRGGVAVVV
ncbi:MAG: gamma-glutamyltransferase [Solirubrobacteraceae bacterium]